MRPSGLVALAVRRAPLSHAILVTPKVPGVQMVLEDLKVQLIQGIQVVLADPVALADPVVQEVQRFRKDER